MENKLIKNFIYNIIYQIIIIIIPIITTPYISRVLGVEGIGINGFTIAVANVFSILILFGLASYGSKSIAIVREDKNKLTEVFWNLWIMQFTIGAIFTIIYIVGFIFLQSLGYRGLFLAQLPLLLSALVDINWFYIGIEEIKKIVTRNLLVKILAVILIFTFVKSKNDLSLYIIINSMSMFLGSLTYWIYLKKYVFLPTLSQINFKRHIKASFMLLIPQLAIQIYTTLDRSIIGLLSNIDEVGYYDQSQKIARIALAVVTSLSIVLMPRIANIFANKQYDKVNYYLKKSINFTMGMALYISCSVIAVSQDFVPTFFGKGYSVVIPYMAITSLIIIFIPIGGIFANQFCIPTGKTKEYTIPLIVAAFYNTISNIILTPRLGALGGVISIVSTEFIVLILRVFLVRKYLNIKDLFKGTYIYIVAGIATMVGTYLVSLKFSSSVKSIIIEGMVATVIYFVIILFTKNQLKDEIIKIMNRVILKRR